MSRGRTRRWALEFCVLGVLCVFALDARAASVRRLSLEEMVDGAEDIVVGRVISTEVHWRGQKIVTVSQIEVQEAIKGSRAPIEITQLGGTAEHPRLGVPVTMTASHQVAFKSGEDVLLFVQGEEGGIRQVVGAHQGKFVIREDPLSQEKELPVAPQAFAGVSDAGGWPGFREVDALG